ncbi:helix-turn-helix transcriptional regulator [Actinomadura scrupuli]|uniref:helix-turn-helix transcriptional regulator n=1 Tax=Actinomadura scrupuli TaxID=559629 RepID=UPI003D98A1F2
MTIRTTEGGLVGRESELRVLTAALDAAAAGRPGVILISGDAGIGKTRLAGQLAATARERGWAVLVGQCAELGESMPYLPLADALRHATRDPARAPGVWDALRSRPVLGRLLPDGDTGPGPGADRPELAQQQLFGAALGLLGELSDTDPVLLVLEDLHWADRSTRDLLTFLSRVLQHERVCLVGTYRSDDLGRRHPLRKVIAELLRLPSVTSLGLRPLEPAEMADHLVEIGGERPSTEVLDHIIERAEGNAFYAEELLDAARTGQELPAGLADVLLSRVERLSETGQRVVRVAAVAGRRVNDDQVRQVSGIDEATYDQTVREVVSEQLLVPDGSEGYMFRHALLQEAVYADLLPGERTRWHAAFARLLAQPHPGRRRSAAELAYHCLASHDLPGAFRASVEAGQEAQRLAAPAEAHEHFEQALSLWDAVPEAERPAGLDRPHLALAAAGAAAHSGEPRRAVTRLRRLLESLDPADDLLLYAEVAERAAYYLSDIDHDLEAAETARSIVELIPADPPTAVRARTLATYSRSLLYTERHEEIPALAEEAIALARATGSLEAEAGALVNLGLYRESRGDLSPAEELFAQARTVAGRAGDLPVAMRAAYHCARAEFDRGELAAAARSAADGVRAAVDTGLGWSIYGTDLRFLEYLIHYTAGDWDLAEALAAQFPVRVGTIAEAQVSSYALFLEIARGDDGVRERLSWLEPLWAQDWHVAYIARGLAAEHALWEGDEETALGHVNAVLEALEPTAAGSIRIATVGLSIHADRAVRARAQRDDAARARAVEAADVLIARARRAATDIASGPRLWLGVEGRAWLARAEAQWHRARGEDDLELWRAAVDGFGYGFTYEVARSRLELAEALLTHGRPEEAEAEWRQAVEVAEHLGAAPLLGALGLLGRRARFGTPKRPVSSGQGPLASLTGREREVLHLVTAGRNNREIASTLFISPKTASVHVSNILAKLGASSRTEAAAIAHREGLTQGPRDR